MSLRKEQVLALATLLFMSLFLLTGGDTAGNTRAARAKYKDESLNPPVPTVFAEGTVPDMQGRDLQVEPKDYEPLPRLAYPLLPLPKLPRLPLLRPPVDPGPKLAYWYYNRVRAGDIKIDAPPKPASGNAGPVPNGGNPGQGAAPGAAATQEDALMAKTYDRIYPVSGRPRWGLVQGEGAARYSYGVPDQQERLQVNAPFNGEVVFYTYSEQTKKMSTLMHYPDGVERIVYADTIQNRIALAKRRIPEGVAGLSDRVAFVHELITTERNHPEALVEAERQADEYTRLAPTSKAGYELKALVYASTAQFEKELALYQELMKGPLQNQSFVLRGLGRLEAKLRLDKLAEAHLRDAVRKDPSAPDSGLALSEFLLSRERIDEALAEIRRATNLVTAATRPDEALAVYCHLVTCLLAQGQFQDAEAAWLKASNLNVQSPRLALLEGAIRYGRGNYSAAATSFADAASGMRDSVKGIIGGCLAKLFDGDAARAMDLIPRIRQRDPLEAHRGLTIRAFIEELRGQNDTARATLQEAQVLAPRDPYLLYLLGRQLVRAGEYEPAVEIIEHNLERNPAMTEGMAEMARLEFLRALQSGRLAWDGYLTKAERFAAKACEDESRGDRDPKTREPSYQDLLGTIRYLQEDYEGARRAFETSSGWNAGKSIGSAPYPRIMLSLIKYRRGAVEDCLDDLTKLKASLRAANDPLDYKAFVEDAYVRIQDNLGKKRIPVPFTTEEWPPVIKEHVTRHKRARWRIDPEKHRAGVVGYSDGENRDAYLRMEIERATDFVSVEATLTLGESQTAADWQLIIRDRSGNNLGNGFELRTGYESGRGSRIYLREGRVSQSRPPLLDLNSENFPAELRFQPGQSLRIRVEFKRGREERSKVGDIIVSFNGTEVARHEVNRLPRSRAGLVFDFSVEGQQGARFEAYVSNIDLVTKG